MEKYTNREISFVDLIMILVINSQVSAIYFKKILNHKNLCDYALAFFSLTGVFSQI